MRLRVVVASIVAWAVMPAPGWSQSAQAAADARWIMDQMRARQLQRWSGTQNYVVTTVINESPVGAGVVLMTRVSPEAGFRLVPPHEVTGFLEEAAGLSAEDKAWAAEGLTQAYLMGIDAVAPSLGGGDQQLIKTVKDGLVEFMATGGRPAGPGQLEADARQAVADMARLAGMLTLAGPLEEVGGRTAFRLDAEKLNRPLEGGFTLQRVHLWVDREHFVPLRLRMIGDYRASDGKTRQVTIEREDADYIAVGTLLEPHRQRFKLSGILSAKEQAELLASKKKMDEQLARLPAAQKEQVMRMMGPQIRQMEAMAKQGDVDVTAQLWYEVGGIETYLMALKRLTRQGKP